MNQNQFNTFIMTHGVTWSAQNIVQFPLSSLRIADDDGQIRVSGILPAHVQSLQEDILARGQQVPITVDSDGECVEGNHRLEAIINLNSLYPDNARFQYVRAYVKEFKTEQEKRSYQLAANAHPPAKVSAVEDYALILKEELVSKKGVKGVKWNNYNNDESNFDTLKNFVLDRWKSYGVNTRKAKTIVKKAVESTPNVKFKNYTKQELTRLFNENNSIGWSGKKSGDVANGIALYPMGDGTHVFPNLTGNTFKKKTDTKDIETVALIWVSNTTGLSVGKLDSKRRELINSINKANSSHLLAKGFSLVDEIYIAPQKLRDGKESSKKCLRVKKKSNGSFNPLSIPTDGWK